MLPRALPRTTSNQPMLVPHYSSTCSNILAAQSYGEHIPIFKVLSIVFNLEKILIDLKRQDVAVPLSLQSQHWHS